MNGGDDVRRRNGQNERGKEDEMIMKETGAEKEMRKDRRIIKYVRFVSHLRFYLDSTEQ